MESAFHVSFTWLQYTTDYLRHVKMHNGRQVIASKMYHIAMTSKHKQTLWSNFFLQADYCVYLLGHTHRTRCRLGEGRSIVGGGSVTCTKIAAATSQNI